MKLPYQEFSDYLQTDQIPGLTWGLPVSWDGISLIREQFVVNWLHLRDIWLAHSYEWKKWEEELGILRNRNKLVILAFAYSNGFLEEERRKLTQSFSKFEIKFMNIKKFPLNELQVFLKFQFEYITI